LASRLNPNRSGTSPEVRPQVRSPSLGRRRRAEFWRPTCPSVPTLSASATPQVHQTRVSSLSGPGTPGIRPVIQDGGGGAAVRPGFPPPFGRRHLLLGSSFAR